MTNTNNYIHWYYDPEATVFFKELIKDINEQTTDKSIEWKDSCYHNDTCGSVCFNLDETGENYVQLWAFHNDHEAKREDMLQYLAVSYRNGQENGDLFYITDDRQQAIKHAIEIAHNLKDKVFTNAD